MRWKALTEVKVHPNPSLAEVETTRTSSRPELDLLVREDGAAGRDLGMDLGASVGGKLVVGVL